MARQITVTDDTLPITFIDRDEQERVLGEIVVDDYEGEARRYSFLPHETNRFVADHKRESGYQLGVGTPRSMVVNPADAQRALINLGWKIKDQVAFKGGLKMRTIFNLPDVTFDDPFHHDLEKWTGSISAEGHMNPAIQLDTDLSLGHMAVRGTAGIFRQVCTNGLTISILDLGRFEYKHLNYDSEDLMLKVQQAGLSGLTQMPTGRAIGEVSDVLQAAKIINRYRREGASDEGLSTAMRNMESVVRTFSQNSVRPWALSGYLRNILDLAKTRKAGDMVYAIDLAQCYTNGVNLHRRANNDDRGAWSALTAMDTVIEGTMTLASISNMFSAN